MVGFRLAVIAHKDVGRQSAVGHQLANGFHPAKIPFHGIFAVHQFQHFVATALYGQVYVPANVWNLGDNAQCGIAHILWVGRREANAHCGNRLGHQSQQLGEVYCLSLFVHKSVAVNVLPQ